MADLTAGFLRHLLDQVPDNYILKVRIPDNGGYTTDEVCLVGVTDDGEVLFLAKSYA